MPKSEDLSMSVEINAIWTFDTEFPTIFNKPCTYITFKSAVKHRQLGYGYPQGQTVHLAKETTQDRYFSISHMYTSMRNLQWCSLSRFPRLRRMETRKTN